MLKEKFYQDFVPNVSCKVLTQKHQPCAVRVGRQLPDGQWICHLHDANGLHQFRAMLVRKRKTHKRLTESELIIQLRAENARLRESVDLLLSSRSSLRPDLRPAEQSNAPMMSEQQDAPGQMIFSDLSNGTELFTKPDDEQAKAIVRRIRIFRKWEEEQNV